MRPSPPCLCALLAILLVAPVARAQTTGATPDAVFTAAVGRVAPSIVGITVTWQPGKQYIRVGPARLRIKRNTGPVSGVILTADGCIATSDFNVNEDVKSIKVRLHDGREFAAKRLGRDISRGVQLIRIDATDLPVPTSVANGDIKVGAWALACGVGEKDAPPTLSVGIVSATERIKGRAIQVDASTNPTNYGGPLCDIQGRVMAIITPLSPNGAGTELRLYDSGIGFAVPLDDLLKQLPRLKAGETIRAAFLGITFDMRYLKGGARIRQVVPGSGAQKGGIKPGDVITEFNGVPIHTSFKLLHAIGACRVGETVRFKVKRNGKEIILKATLGTRPKNLR